MTTEPVSKAPYIAQSTLIQIAGVLVALGLMVMGSSMARADVLLRSIPHDSTLQYGLIASGALEAPPGSSTKAALKAALQRYVKIYGPITETGGARRERLAAHYTSFVEEFQITPTKSIGDKILPIPKALVTAAAGTELEAYFRSQSPGVMIYFYQFSLQRNPPFEMLRKTLEAANDARIRSVSHTTHDFRVWLEDFAIAKQGALTQKVARHQIKMAFADGDKLIGFYMTFNDQPPAAFVVPRSLSQLRDYWTPLTALLDGPRPELAAWMADRGLSTVQQSELEALASGDPASRTPDAVSGLVTRWVWRHAMRAVAWIIQDDFDTQNRFSSVDIAGCHASRDKTQYPNDVRVVFASNRLLSERELKNSTSPATWFGAEAEPDNGLNIGCASMAVASVVGGSAASSGAEAGRGASDGSPGVSILKARSLSRQLPGKSTYSLKFKDTERWLHDDETRALVFVHGYNTSFDYALSRAAQIAATTKYKGRVYLFSWPSAEDWKLYLSDMDSAERSELHLTGFLRAILRDPELQRIDIVAHSMGAQMVMRTLNDLRDVFYARDGVRLGQVIFAAPDVATDVFAEKVREVGALADGVTVYGSAKDKALWASSSVRGNSQRLGLILNGAVPRFQGIAFVDATSTSSACNLWGYTQMEHSYYGEDPTMLQHVSAVLSRTLRKGVGRVSEEDKYVTAMPEGHWKLKAESQVCWWNPW